MQQANLAYINAAQYYTDKVTNTDYLKKTNGVLVCVCVCVLCCVCCVVLCVCVWACACVCVVLCCVVLYCGVCVCVCAVSYTHLTLPTNHRV